MGLQYDAYLEMHRLCVRYAVKWITNNFSMDELSIILPDLRYKDITEQVLDHDKSKNDKKEYDAYNNYFYSERTPEVEKQFDYAWLHHLHHNKHHWQYWILKEDDSYVEDDKIIVKALDMPDNFVLEMIADWWSFSWKQYLTTKNKQDLYEIFNWYDEHVDKIVLSNSTKDRVELMLNKIKEKLDSHDDTIELINGIY